MNKPVIIIGAGDHAKVLLDILLEQNVNVIGLTDKSTKQMKQSLLMELVLLKIH